MPNFDNLLSNFGIFIRYLLQVEKVKHEGRGIGLQLVLLEPVNLILLLWAPRLFAWDPAARTHRVHPVVQTLHADARINAAGEHVVKALVP